MNGTFYLETPIGPLGVRGNGRAITEVFFAEDESARDARLEETLSPGDANGADLVIDRALAELSAYFRGEPISFSVPLEPAGTDFERAVWLLMVAIPRGSTRTYGELAVALGKPRAARAVGGAAHRNPIGIIIPCHRVVGASGSLVGYAGGLDKKSFLLNLEGSRLL